MTEIYEWKSWKVKPMFWPRTTNIIEGILNKFERTWNENELSSSELKVFFWDRVEEFQCVIDSPWFNDCIRVHKKPELIKKIIDSSKSPEQLVKIFGDSEFVTYLILWIDYEEIEGLIGDIDKYGSLKELIEADKKSKNKVI